jgi:transcriptional regulator with XRE-family HTH domain
MSPIRLKEIRTMLRLSRASMGALFGVSASLVQLWEAGRANIPQDIADWLERRATGMLDDPPPQYARKRGGQA